MKNEHTLIRQKELNDHLVNNHGWTKSMIETQGDGFGQFGPYAWSWHSIQHSKDRQEQ